VAKLPPFGFGNNEVALPQFKAQGKVLDSGPVKLRHSKTASGFLQKRIFHFYPLI